MMRMVYALVFLTGFSGLTCQVVWHKYLAIFLGSHAFATSLVLATFFGFLSLGYAIFGRYSNRLTSNRLLSYAGLEAAIGIFCLFNPPYYHFLSNTLSAYNPSLLRDLLMAVLFLGPPTFLMGGTIPILTEALSYRFENSHKVHARVYGINTFGAVLGSLMAGFVLIESLGLPLTLMLAACINLVVAMAAFVISQAQGQSWSGPELRAARLHSDLKYSPSVRKGLYVLAFCSGFYTFSLESLVVRLAGLCLGNTTYTFTTIVAAFIMAIALGSFWVSRSKAKDPLRFMIRSQLALVLASLATYLSIPYWPALFARIKIAFHVHEMNFAPYWVAVFLAFVILLVIPVGLMGMNLPLLFGFLRSRDRSLSSVVGKVYSINTLGCSLGALIGGYLVFNFLDGAEVFKLNILLMVASLAIVYLIFHKPTRALVPAMVGVTSLAGLGLWALPSWTPATFVPGFFTEANPNNRDGNFSDYVTRFRNRDERVIFHRFDPNTTVDVMEYSSGARSLYVNGTPDAISNIDAPTRSLNALIPIALSSKVEKVFICGLGAGLSSAIVHSQPGAPLIDVAEISKGVLEALPFFDAFNANLSKDTSRLQLENGDAFSILKSKKESYDLILTEPSNPWLQGVEMLYSEEFLKIVQERLTEGGIYAQWFPLQLTDQGSLISALNTFQRSFAWSTVWHTNASAILMIGSKTPPHVSVEKLNTHFENNKSWYKAAGISEPTSLLALQLLTPVSLRALLQGEEATHKLEYPKLSYASGRAFFGQRRSSIAELVSRSTRMGLPRATFLYDEIAAELPESFFSEARRFLGGNNKFALRRLEESYEPQMKKADSTAAPKKFR